MGDEEEQAAVPVTIQHRAPPPRIDPPGNFDFSDPGKWTRWRARWLRYREASRINEHPEREQINTLIYSLGEQAEDIILSRGIPENTHDEVLRAFNDYFGVRTNIIVERAKFNRLVQNGDGMDVFINKIYRQAEYCEYGALREELIRDRIVVGVDDDQLSDKLQSEAALTLANAVQISRRHEAAKQAKTMLRPTNGTVESVRSNHSKQKPYGSQNKPMSKPDSNQPKCSRCGNTNAHNKYDCPAIKSKCRSCKKLGHWENVCRSKPAQVTEVAEDDSNAVFLGEINSQVMHDRPWKAELHVRFGDKPERSTQFKLDSGAEVTVCGIQTYIGDESELQPSDKKLFGPGGIPLPVRGLVKAQIRVDSQTIHEKIYIVDNQSTNLLSKRACVSLGLIQCNTKYVYNIDSNEDKSVKFYHEFSDIFSGLGKVNVTQPYRIQVREDVKPTTLYVPYGVSQPRLPIVKKQLDEMESKGIISKVTVPTDWCSGMVQVPKEDPTQIRICADLTKLNRAVKRDTHPSSSVDNTLAKISGAKFMTKLDANSGYYQIPLADDSRLLTTFITPFGRYCYNRVPFGLVSSGDIFQRCMFDILDGLDGVVCHMDDLLVYSAVSEEEHDDRVRKVLQRLEDVGMTLNPKKCLFCKKSVKFLGHMISEQGIHPDPNRIKDILELPDPTCIKELQSFLGSVNQLGKFSHRISNLTQPIRALLSHNDWTWNASMTQAVKDIKTELSKAPCLGWYDVNKPIIIMSDASNQGLGSVLFQVQPDGSRRLIASKSRSLTDTESRWSTIELEALGIAWACSKFEMYILGHTDVTIETDHKPLVPIFNSKAVNDLTIRIQRQRLRTLKYAFTVQHVPGKCNSIADLLSRQPLYKPDAEDRRLAREIEIAAVSTVSSLPASEHRLHDLRLKQAEDTTLRQVIHFVNYGWPNYLSDVETHLKPYWQGNTDITLMDNLLLYNQRIVIPICERSEILKRIHTGHLGIHKCRERARQSVWWPGISQEIAEMVKNCRTCQIHQPERREPLKPTVLPDRPWQRVATDLFHFKNEDYILVVDYYSRYIEFSRLNSLTSTAVINSLKSIFARHGIPETVMSDNGPCYASQEYRRFATEYCFESLTSSPRYPQANGEAEKCVQTVKNLIKKAADPYLALLSYRNTPIHNGFSPAEMLMGRRLRTDLPADPSTLKPYTPDHGLIAGKEHQYKENMKCAYDNRHNVKELPTLNRDDPVYVRDLDRPGTVTENLPGRSHIITTDTGTVRRNRRSLSALPNTAQSPQPPEITHPPVETATPRPTPVTPTETPTDARRTSSRVSHHPERLGYARLGG